jgi:hypothetical protein
VFIIGFIAHFNEFHEHEFRCKDGSTPKFRGGGFDQVVAVIGAQSSSVTIQVRIYPKYSTDYVKYDKRCCAWKISRKETTWKT